MLVIWICRILSLASAFGVGYFFGYTVPDWRDDKYLDEAAEQQRYAGYGGWSYRGSGCFSSMLFAGMMAPDESGAKAYSIALGILSLVFAWYGFGLPEGMGEDYGDVLLLFYAPFWMVLGCVAVGYIYARLTDKGPVGPLE